MFQRFKEASSSLSSFVDQLADEQNRLRAQQAGQKNANASGQRVPQRPRPSTPGSSSRPKPDRTSTEDQEKALNLSGPDPDPATFETDATTEEQEATKQEPDSVPARSSADITPAVAKLENEEAAPTIALAEGERMEEKAEGSAILREATPELPDDVQMKLKKLGKLESKYSDLLKAYRRAHARNALIEPFEARLRESTPLTSIGDPGALLEYLTQLNTKGDMVMQELKKISSEKDDLLRKLEEAEQKTRDAYDDISKLRDAKPETESTSDPSILEAGQEGEPTIAENMKIENMKIPSTDVFSFEAEVPRLEAELQQRTEQVVSLQHENDDLKRDLGVAKETTEQMIVDMKAARKELESMQLLHTQIKDENTKQRTLLETRVRELENELNTSRNELSSFQVSSGQADEDSKKEHQDLQEHMERLQMQLDASRDDLSTLQDKQTEAYNTHQQEVIMLQNTVSDIKSKLQTAETEARSQKDKLTTSEAALAHMRSRMTLQATVAPNVSTTAQQIPPVNDAGGSKKKNNKKKNKKKGANAATADGDTVENASTSANGEGTVEKLVAGDELVNLQIRYDDCLAQLNEKTMMLERLEKKLKAQDDLIEEIEGLREELLSIGQEHVEAKDKLSAAETEKQRLQHRLNELEQEISELQINLHNDTETSDNVLTALKEEVAKSKAAAEQIEHDRTMLEAKVKKLEQDMEVRENAHESTIITSAEAQKKLEADFEGLKSESRSLQTDLSAAEQLAATRYKEMTSLRDMLQRAQPELSSLRTEVAELRNAREELGTKSKELRRLELREENLRSEMDLAKNEISAREQDIRNLNQKLSQETSQRVSADELLRKSQRDLQRLQQERNEAIAVRDSVTKDLIEATKNMVDSRSKLNQLQQQVDQLSADTDGLRDEITLKTAQHASAELLMTSVRDQAGEMAIQLKEAKERCESLEEELTDIHRLMGERGRENETMRRLLADVETRAESRIKEMRERMELTMQERDRAEEDASLIGRRKTREIDETKNRLRSLEHDLKRSLDEKEELRSVETDLRQYNLENDRRLEQSKLEVEEVRRAMSELRDALDDGERQTREFDSERTEFKRLTAELQQQVEKLQKSNKTLSDDLRSARTTRMRPTDSPAQSTRSSLESSRPAKITSPTSPISVRTSSFSIAPNSGIDYVYLKNVLLQFLEQKDKNHQKQLVPVLGMLLHFDKKDEQKWMSAINTK